MRDHQVSTYISPRAAWLRDHLKEHGHALAPGQIVLAGTALDLYPVDGDHVAVFVDDRLAVQYSVR